MRGGRQSEERTHKPHALDPSVMLSEEGFTEELAAAMQPFVAPTEALAKTPLDILEEAGKKLEEYIRLRDAYFKRYDLNLEE